MTSQDFCYWLQGYFELRESTGALGGSQVEIIARHVAIVSDPGPGVLAVKALLPMAADSVDVTRAIASVLAGVFEHVIDPKAGPASPALTVTHNGGTGGPLVRC